MKCRYCVASAMGHARSEAGVKCGLYCREPAVNTEDRFIEIEIKLVHQEDLVESLNQIVYEQQKRIDKLEALCGALAQHLSDDSQGGLNTVNEKPPHY